MSTDYALRAIAQHIKVQFVAVHAVIAATRAVPFFKLVHIVKVQ